MKLDEMFGPDLGTNFEREIHEIEMGFRRLEDKVGGDFGRTVTSFYRKWVGPPSEDDYLQDRLKQIPRADRKQMENDFLDLLKKTAKKHGYEPRFHKMFRTYGYFMFPIK